VLPTLYSRAGKGPPNKSQKHYSRCRNTHL
jgi:hypothetical protein